MKYPQISPANRSRHPANPHGQGSPEFWKAEYILYGLTAEQYSEIYNRDTGKCPYCGVTYGTSPGTGDCGCDPDPE